jgi:hypothetical protein
VPGFTTFIVGTVAVLGVYLGGLLVLRGGFARRVLLASCLLWVIGWITVVPSTAAASLELFYATAVLLGSSLGCGALTVRVLGLSVGPWSSETAAGHLLLAGSAVGAPGTVGLLFGEEVLALAFVLTAAVAVILLFLFR